MNINYSETNKVHHCSVDYSCILDGDVQIDVTEWGNGAGVSVSLYNKNTRQRIEFDISDTESTVLVAILKHMGRVDNNEEQKVRKSLIGTRDRYGNTD